MDDYHPYLLRTTLNVLVTFHPLRVLLTKLILIHSHNQTHSQVGSDHLIIKALCCLGGV